ncbi:5-amino-6-(D-ribitylamino)uracil--L-tyrosine 4-hydroxyphenyl transferase CofH [Bradyrhizobium sp.]|uniref:5-amino-6-(D-ribitylamino)uracil--L-tyrosine 4-hydroxyphenyl transferase CofH n=1 Tax=Bradyrhizobium sp. TaxID=376 RepID=UPI003C76F7C7
MSIGSLVRNFPLNHRLTRDEAAELIHFGNIETLLDAAAKRRDAAHGRRVSFSRKVFIPLTQLCRDVCHYCTFAHAPRAGESPYLPIDKVVAIAQAGNKAGCKEALFTLGDKPELRYRAAREQLDRLGHPTTLSYVAAAASAVFRETGLLAHINPGLMTGEDIDALRKVSVSLGIMLESASGRLGKKGGPHFGSPDKIPAARLETMRLAGERSVPFTSGILIGIGETPQERIDSLFALRDLHEAYGHIQEIIIQNFRPKPGTRMENVAPPDVDDHLWTIAVARLIFEPSMNIQAPPNLSPGALGRMVAAGINDWGGVSPVTPDHVNPEAPWPHLRVLEAATKAAGMELTERLAIYPAFARDAGRWLDRGVRKAVLDRIDAEGMARVDDWCPGHAGGLPSRELDWLEKAGSPAPSKSLGRMLARAQRGDALDEPEIVDLFRARGDDFAAVCRAADELRRETNGDVVSYVVTRNINYTNICSFKCQFCAFSKGRMSENLRGRPYDLELQEVAERVTQAWQRGASEVCMQGGIHPSYTGQKYLDICRTVKDAVPQIHMHAFSPLEIFHGAQTLDMPVIEFLRELKAAGLGTLPGTAAEILDDEVREVLCADKIRTRQWLDVMRAAHAAGFRSTATIMFGHIEGYQHWARHLQRIRALQSETGGFTEFVPLPFVHMEAPVYLKGRARPGPTFREAILMHAVARLVLNPLIPNIQASWVKLGAEGVRRCLSAGVNDLGGTLMDESISRSAGASHGQEMTPQEMETIIFSAGRIPRQRTTIYGDAADAMRRRSFESAAARMAVSGRAEGVTLAAGP